MVLCILSLYFCLGCHKVLCILSLYCYLTFHMVLCILLLYCSFSFHVFPQHPTRCFVYFVFILSHFRDLSHLQMRCSVSFLFMLCLFFSQGALFPFFLCFVSSFNQVDIFFISFNGLIKPTTSTKKYKENFKAIEPEYLLKKADNMQFHKTQLSTIFFQDAKCFQTQILYPIYFLYITAILYPLIHNENVQHVQQCTVWP